MIISTVVIGLILKIKPGKNDFQVRKISVEEDLSPGGEPESKQVESFLLEVLY